MDKYNSLANNILKNSILTSSHIISKPLINLSEEYEETPKRPSKVRSLEGFFTGAEIEDQEAPAPAEKLEITPEEEKVMGYAKNLATKASGGFMGSDPQKKINKVYGDIMKNVAKKLDVIQGKLFN